MTVKELIEELQAANPNAEVVISNENPLMGFQTEVGAVDPDDDERCYLEVWVG